MLPDLLLQRATALKLHGLIAHWDKIKENPLILQLIEWEERHRSEKSLNNRLRSSRIGNFKPLAEFDWAWPKMCDRESILRWMQVDFIKKPSNLILCGPNGVGKTTIARNVAYQSVVKGHTALFTTASDMLNELAALDSDSGLRRRMKHYTHPALLIIDEVGYLAYANRYADLLFEIISQRYEKKSTFITTNRPFTEWNAIFPTAACVVSIIDRLVHHSEIVNIEAESYRIKEAKEKSLERAKARRLNNKKQVSVKEQQS